MTRALCAAACVVAAWPVAAQAQQLSGLVAASVGQTSNMSDGRPDDSRLVSQQYVLGIDTPFLDRRLLRVNAEGAFRDNGLSSHRAERSLAGNQRGFGYKLGGAIFPQRSFPLVVRVARDIVDESGEFPTSSQIRGGIALPDTQVLPAFQTVTRSLSANWQLTSPLLPRIDLGYTSGRADTNGSVFHAAQSHEDLHAGVVKESTRIRHAFRYDNNDTNNLILSAYDQRNTELDYEFGALLSARSRLNVHTGRRRMVSLFDVPTPVVDPAAGGFFLPSRGDTSTQYVVAGISVDPTRRISLEASGSADRQTSSPASIGARLANTSARLDVGHGLMLNGTATYGTRDQFVGTTSVTVETRSAQAGASFRTGPRWFETSVNGSRGAGRNQTPNGVTGTSSLWSGQAMVTSSIRWLSLSAGRERSEARDDLLDFGNASTVRDRAALQVQPGRVSVNGTWENAIIERGRATTFAHLRQRTASGSLSVRVARRALVTGTAGNFDSVASFGTDTTRYWGGALEFTPSTAFHLTGWLRRDHITATQTGLDQRTFAWFGLGEYRIRDFTLALEYRNTDQLLQASPGLAGYRFQGRQILFRVSRKLSMAL